MHGRWAFLLHKQKSENNIQDREPEPVASWSIIFQIHSSHMREYEGHDSRPDKMRRTQIHTHKRGTHARRIDVGVFKIHSL